MTTCDGCAIIARIESGSEPYVVARTRSGYVSIHVCQYYRGYTVFLAKSCVAELHELAGDERRLFLDEMALVAESVFRAFSPRKLNYELLGNTTAHLHWHLIPRHADDPKPSGPVWEDEAFVSGLKADQYRVSAEEMAALKSMLADELDHHDGLVEIRYA